MHAVLRLMSAQAAAAAGNNAGVERLVAGVKAAVEMSDTLNGWVLLVLGGTLAVVFSTSYRKPPWPYRAMFLLLLPAISLLANSMVAGSHVRQAYPPMFLRKDATLAATEALSEVNRSLGTQIESFRFAMLVLAAWLLCYLVWWIFVDKAHSEDVSQEKQTWSPN
jgi:thiosulfate reductase cytochrome b subunit